MSFDHTILKGTTSKIVEVMLRDKSTGLGIDSIDIAQITASYVREGGTRTAITLVSGTAGDSYSSGKWCEVDSTNCQGLYQFHIPNAALASGVNAVTITFQANPVSQFLDKTVRVSLLDVDLRNATNAGLSNFDAAVSTRSTFDASADTVANVTAVGSVSGSVGSVVGNVGGSVDSVTNAVGSVIGNVGGSVGSVAGNVVGSVGSVVAAVVTDSASRTASKATLADLTGVALASGQLTSTNVSDAVWNVSTASYNAAGTFGKGFRLVQEGLISADGQAASNGTTTSFVSNLSSSVNDFYNGRTIVFVSGALSGQSRVVTDYDGTTKTITVDSAEPFTSAVQSGDEFILLAVHTHAITEIVSSIWSEPQANFAGDTGSFGYYLDAAVSTAGGGGSVTVSDITQAALAKFASVDTGETTAVDGSVAKISQRAAGGNVTVGAFTQAALASFADTDTGETSIVDGSVVSLAGGYVINSAQSVAASDVRSGVPIGGSSVGTLVVPPESDVEIGVQYGASGTEYTGSLSSLPTVDSLPIVNNGNVKNLISGNTYRNGFGDVPSWNWLTGTFPAYSAGATATLVLSMKTRPSDRTEMSLEIDDSGSPVVLRLELTPEQSGQLVSGSYRYDIEIQWANGDKKTMAFGDLFVYEPYSLQV